ncbi:MAG: hypothetical protein WDO74_26310 [Pseudomonadota bacterium]
MTVRALESSDMDAVVGVLVSAFAGDVLLVLGVRRARASGHARRLRMTIALSVSARAAYGYFDGERLSAVALYQRSGEAPSVWQSLRAGFWRVPIHAGPRAAHRIARAFAHAGRFQGRAARRRAPSLPRHVGRTSRRRRARRRTNVA